MWQGKASSFAASPWPLGPTTQARQCLSQPDKPSHHFFLKSSLQPECCLINQLFMWILPNSWLAFYYYKPEFYKADLLIYFFKSGHGRVSLRLHQPDFSVLIVLISPPLFFFSRRYTQPILHALLFCFSSLFLRFSWYPYCAPMKGSMASKWLVGLSFSDFFPFFTLIPGWALNQPGHHRGLHQLFMSLWLECVYQQSWEFPRWWLQKQTLFFSSLLSRPTLRLSPLMTSERVCGSVKLMTWHVEFQSKDIFPPLWSLFPFWGESFQKRLWWWWKWGGVPAGAPLREMCGSYLCVCLRSHGNHLFPLLFLKNTCLWEYHSKKEWCFLLLFWRLAKSILPESLGTSYYLGNDQLIADWSKG